MMPAHDKLLLRRDAGIAGEIRDQAVAEAQDEPSRRTDIGGEAARREELGLVLLDESGRQSVGVRGRDAGDHDVPDRRGRAQSAPTWPDRRRAILLSRKKKKCISPPTIRGACLASTTFTVLELGASLTDMSGFEQLPALAEG